MPELPKKYINGVKILPGPGQGNFFSQRNLYREHHILEPIMPRAKNTPCGAAHNLAAVRTEKRFGERLAIRGVEPGSGLRADEFETIRVVCERLTEVL